MSYCPDCGAPLEAQWHENRERDFCPRCQRIHYRQLKVGAGGIIESDGKLLLLQRTHQPFKGCWNLPAGYAEVDESPYQTVVREVFEEVGLRVEVNRLFDLFFYQDDPRGNGILVVFKCHVIGGGHQISREAGNFQYFAPDELPAQLAGGGHDQAVMRWQQTAFRD